MQPSSRQASFRGPSRRVANHTYRHESQLALGGDLLRLLADSSWTWSRCACPLALANPWLGPGHRFGFGCRLEVALKSLPSPLLPALCEMLCCSNSMYGLSTPLHTGSWLSLPALLHEQMIIPGQCYASGEENRAFLDKVKVGWALRLHYVQPPTRCYLLIILDWRETTIDAVIWCQ